MKSIVAIALMLITLTAGMQMSHARPTDSGNDDLLARSIGPHAPNLMVRPGKDDRPSAPPRGYVLDDDDDGRVSRAEADAHYRWMFAILDVDRDGHVRRSEFVHALDTGRRDPIRREAQIERLRVLFARLDSDGDRLVMRPEFLEACRTHFSTSDADGDGEVSVWEFRSKRPL